MANDMDTGELDNYLAGLPGRMREPIARAVREQAEMLSEAQRRALQANEQSPDDTGNLEASCVAVPGSNDLEMLVQAGGSGVDYDYALAFEFGNSRQPARPFFYPTYREKRDEIVQAIGDAVSEALK